jgi:cardiolipin synthase
MAVLTAANQLTLLRLLLVPVFVLFMLYGWPGWALVTFMIAGATDAFDGLLARRLGPTASARGSADGGGCLSRRCS